MHLFIAEWCAGLRRTRQIEPRIYTAFDETVILFHQII